MRKPDMIFYKHDAWMEQYGDVKHTWEKSDTMNVKRRRSKK